MAAETWPAAVLARHGWFTPLLAVAEASRAVAGTDLAHHQCESALDDVVRSQYSFQMKTAVIPQVRVEPELRADLDSVLLPGETLTDFVEASVRTAVEFRRVQTDFAARCDASLAEFERTGISIPADVVLSKLAAKVAARVKQLRK